MSLEEHRDTVPLGEDSAAAPAQQQAHLDEAAAIANAALGDAAAGDDEEGPSSSAANVLPKAQLQHGLNVAKGLFTSTFNRARKSLEDLNESEAMQKVKEATKPVVSAVVEGAKVAGEKLHQGAEAAKPQLEKGLHGLQQAGQTVVEKAKPTLEKAGETIKTTATHVVEQTKPAMDKATTFIQDKLGGGKGGNGGDDQPPHTV